MDRRIQKTESAIFHAFYLLLEQKTYSKITIQEIIDLANIGRSTFYSHFETKDELLKAICKEIFDHIFSATLFPEADHDFSEKEGDVSFMITHILYHLKSNKKIIRGILLNENGRFFQSYLKEYLNRFVSDYILKENRLSSFSVPYPLLLNHITGSFIEIIKWWFENGLVESPEELTLYYSKLVLSLLKE